jgi:dolichol-phosphate mannosyltransferase
MDRAVVVPTYNESRNIERLCREIHAQAIPGLSILVVDDRSPDGTAAIAAALSRELPEVRVLERIDDKGRGTAGITGFEYAIREGARAIVEMDADFSHPPECLPALFEKLSDADIVIASRLAKGARDNRPLRRRALTRFSNAYVRWWLARPGQASAVGDWTSGFRAYRREVFEKIPPSTLVSRGPSILQEVLFRALNLGFTAVEIPFLMNDREEGQSTFSRKVAVQSLVSVPAYRAIFGGVSASGGGPAREFRLADYRFREIGPGHVEVSRGPSSTG